MNKTKSKSIALLFALVIGTPLCHSATVDLGFTLGKVVSGTAPLSGTAVRLGVFTGYSDVLGVGFFTGKNYATLFSSFTALDTNPGDPTTLAGGSDAGTYYASFLTSDSTNYTNIAANTRLFAWFWDSALPSGSSNWAVLSGTIGGSGDVNASWLAVAPSDLTVNIIEAGVVSTQIYAKASAQNQIEAVIGASDNNANLVLIPEPASVSLLIVGFASLLTLRRKLGFCINGA